MVWFSAEVPVQSRSTTYYYIFCYQERVSSFFPRRTMEQDERSAMGIYGGFSLGISIQRCV